MSRTMLAIVIAASASKAFALSLQTGRNPMCGVESYNSRADAQCGVASYREARSPDCGVEHYNTKFDMSCPGSHPATAPIPPVAICTEPSGDCGWFPEAASCEKPEFGVDSYKSCRTPGNGIEAYNSCSLPQFGVAAYKPCSFYMTPEQLDGYLTATESSFETYSVLLPGRQADLLSRTRAEDSFVCLARKYQILPGYESVVEDLSQKFFITFGYELKDSAAVCSSDPNVDLVSQVKITLVRPDATLDCDSFSLQTLGAATASSNATDTAMQHFKQNCSLKLSYTVLVDWFHQTSNDLQQLAGDLSAQQIANLASRVSALEAKVKNAAATGGQ